MRITNMQMRLCKFPFWTFFWSFQAINLLFVSLPVIQLIMLLAGQTDFATIKSNLILLSIDIPIAIITIIVLYLIWRHKNPLILQLSNKNGVILKKKEVLYRFRLQSVLVNPEYPDLGDFILTGITLGQTTLTIWLEDGQELKYELGIMRMTSKKLKRYVENHRY